MIEYGRSKGEESGIVRVRQGGRRMKLSFRFVSVLFLAALVIGLPALRAEWSPDGTLNCGEPHDQYNPMVTDDGYGGMILAWMDDRTETSADRNAQRVDSDGNPLWAEDGVPACVSDDNLSSMRIVSDGAGGAELSPGRTPTRAPTRYSSSGSTRRDCPCGPPAGTRSARQATTSSATT